MLPPYALQVLTRLKGRTALQAQLLFLSRFRLGTIAYSVKNVQVSVYFLTGVMWRLFFTLLVPFSVAFLSLLHFFEVGYSS